MAKKEELEELKNDLKETVDSVSALVSETVKDVSEKAEPHAEKAKEAFREAAKKAEPHAEKAKEAFREAAKKAEPYTEKATDAIREAAKKAEPYTEKAKKTAKQAAKKAGLAAPQVILQYGAYEADMDAIKDKVKAAFVAEGHRLSTIRELKIYVKPEENCAYYVINEKYFGKVHIFEA